jgi:hypothetical protein
MKDLAANLDQSELLFPAGTDEVPLEAIERLQELLQQRKETIERLQKLRKDAPDGQTPRLQALLERLTKRSTEEKEALERVGQKLE